MKGIFSFLLFVYFCLWEKSYGKLICLIIWLAETNYCILLWSKAGSNSALRFDLRRLWIWFDLISTRKQQIIQIKCSFSAEVVACLCCLSLILSSFTIMLSLCLLITLKCSIYENYLAMPHCHGIFFLRHKQNLNNDPKIIQVHELDSEDID